MPESNTLIYGQLPAACTTRQVLGQYHPTETEGGHISETLKGKVALVTGGISGIGRTTTLVFSRQGTTVVVAGGGTDGGEGTVSFAMGQQLSVVSASSSASTWRKNSLSEPLTLATVAVFICPL